MRLTLIALLVAAAAAQTTNLDLAQYMVIEMQTAHNPTDGSLFSKIDLFSNLGLDQSGTADASSIGPMYTALLPYSFTNAAQYQFTDAGLPTSISQAYDNDNSINTGSSLYINHGRAHAFMVRNYPRCFAKGGVIYDVPMGEASSRPLHLTDLIGFLTYKNPKVQQVFENSGSPYGNPPYEYVQNHFPKAFAYLQSYDNFESRVLASDFYSFTSTLNDDYANAGDACNGGSRYKPSGDGDGDGDYNADNGNGVTATHNSKKGLSGGALVATIVGTAVGGCLVGFLVALTVTRRNRSRANSFVQFGYGAPQAL